MSKANVKIMLTEKAGYDPSMLSMLERTISDWEITCEPVVDGAYKHTFTMPSQPITPISVSLTEFVPEKISGQILAEAIIRAICEAIPPHVWQSYFAHKRAVHRAKLRRRRKIRYQQRRRRRGLA